MEMVVKMAAIPQVRDHMSMRVVSVDSSDSVYNAADIIMRNNVGCVVITEYSEIVGILTKGDILKKSLLMLRDPKTTKVSSIMSRSPVTIESGATLEDAAKLMTEKNVSKLPVLDQGLLVGVVSSTDIIRVAPEYLTYLRGLIEKKVERPA